MSDEDVLDRPGREPDHTLRLGPEPENLADVWWPTRARPEPAVVVVVHGGFWKAAYDRAHTRPMCAALADHGHTVAAIEFRRTGMPGGGWPGTLDDVQTALTALGSALADAAAADQRPAPPETTLLLGHSAGGQLVLWAGSRVPVSGLAGVVSLAGVCDLARAHDLRLGGGAVDAFLDGSPAERPERYADADPMVLPPPPAPVVLIHGVEDDVVPIELSRRYAERPTPSGTPVDLLELSGVEHYGPIDPTSGAWEAVTGTLDRLARR